MLWELKLFKHQPYIHFCIVSELVDWNLILGFFFSEEKDTADLWITFCYAASSLIFAYQLAYGKIGFIISGFT